MQHQTAGDLPKAESICKQILQTDPNQAQALYLLGVVTHQARENGRTVDFVARSLVNKLDYAEACYIHGNTLGKLGRLDEVIVHYQKALEIKPNFTGIHNNLGSVLTA